MNAEKPEPTEEKTEFFLKNCREVSECSEKTRFCVVGESKM